MTQNPLLSIGIIFKNEIRCLERCLKSLQPLRDAIPCELVMADTGATDGSRAVAEKYADILIDFPWINDFAAARNAVIEQAHGKWFMSLDCDEWLSDSIAQLVNFLSDPSRPENYFGFIIRNYKTRALDADEHYNDFPATRIFRMSTGTRYEGAIHEHYNRPSGVDQTTLLLAATIVHHDGYVYDDPVKAKQKAERNMTLLREELKKEPENLLRLMQCVESTNDPEETLSCIRTAINLIKEKKPTWEQFGAPLVRYAVIIAKQRKLPELGEWIELAHSLFPTSLYTRVDVEYVQFGKAWDESKYDEAIIHGKNYLKAMEEYTAGQYDYRAMMVSVLSHGSPSWVRGLNIFLISAYLYEKQYEDALQVLSTMNFDRMTVKQASDGIRTLGRLHQECALDTSDIMCRFWEAIDRPLPTKEIRNERYNELLKLSFGFFRGEYRKDEETKEHFVRPAYTMFLPLDGRNILGIAAAILCSDDPAVIREKLSTVERWNELPAPVVEHAVNCGVAFPIEGATLNTEQTEDLAIRLANDGCDLSAMLRTALPKNSNIPLYQLNWVCSLALVSIFRFPWTTDDVDKITEGQELFRIFSDAEKQFLSSCYHAEILTEETLFLLPPVHRFGWYAQYALSALASGAYDKYVRFLRKGLATCPNMKDMVKFLVDHTEALKPPVSPELRELAEKVRTILAAYPADDPAVVALKQTPAYQQVAFLIEEN